jgi:hypothetical protein
MKTNLSDCPLLLPHSPGWHQSGKSSKEINQMPSLLSLDAMDQVLVPGAATTNGQSPKILANLIKIGHDR